MKFVAITYTRPHTLTQLLGGERYFDVLQDAQEWAWECAKGMNVICVQITSNNPSKEYNELIWGKLADGRLEESQVRELIKG